MQPSMSRMLSSRVVVECLGGFAISLPLIASPVDLAWDAPTDAGLLANGNPATITGYVITFAIDGGLPSTQTLAATANTATLSHFSDAREMVITIAATNASGTGPRTQITYEIPQTSTGGGTVVRTVGTFNGVYFNGNISLSWANVFANATRFTLIWVHQGVANTINRSGDQTSYTLDDVEVGTTYAFTLTAFFADNTTSVRTTTVNTTDTDPTPKLWVKDSTNIWRTASKVHEKRTNTLWDRPDNLKVKVGGTWRRFFQRNYQPVLVSDGAFTGYNWPGRNTGIAYDNGYLYMAGEDARLARFNISDSTVTVAGRAPQIGAGDNVVMVGRDAWLVGSNVAGSYTRTRLLRRYNHSTQEIQESTPTYSVSRDIIAAWRDGSEFVCLASSSVNNGAVIMIRLRSNGSQISRTTISGRNGSLTDIPSEERLQPFGIVKVDDFFLLGFNVRVNRFYANQISIFGVKDDATFSRDASVERYDLRRVTGGGHKFNCTGHGL